MLDSFEDEFENSSNQEQYWFTAQKMKKVEAIHDYLDSLKEVGNVQSFATVLKVGRTLNDGEDLDNLKLALLYNELPEKFKEIVLYPYVDIPNDQLRFSMRIIDSQEGLRRDELIQKIDRELKEQFQLNDQTLHLSNMLILYNNMLQSLFDSQILTLGIVVLILFMMFLLLFRDMKIALIAIVTNIVSVGVIFGVMGWTGIPLDMMTITIAAISVGIAVDDTIHYIHRFKIEYAKERNYLKAMHQTHESIGYAMYYTSIAIMIGFSVLMISNFIPTIYFGFLTLLAMFSALSANLLLLPRLMVDCKPLD
jgi:predicted RND superfamily exporter protein